MSGWLPVLEGLGVDLAISHRSPEVATVSARTRIPARTLVDMGARYGFRLAGKSILIRLQVENLTNLQGFELQGAGAYDLIPGRRTGGYLTIDF